MFNTFDAVLPIPSVIQKHDGVMPVSELKTFHVPEELQIFSDEIMRTAAFFGLRILPSPDPDADLVLKLNSGLGAEAWFMRIDPSSILIEGGGKAGLFYALAAFSQMLITALIKGPAGAVLNCGTACDNGGSRGRNGRQGCRHCADAPEEQGFHACFLHESDIS